MCLSFSQKQLRCCNFNPAARLWDSSSLLWVHVKKPRPIFLPRPRRRARQADPFEPESTSNYGDRGTIHGRVWLLSERESEKNGRQYLPLSAHRALKSGRLGDRRPFIDLYIVELCERGLLALQELVCFDPSRSASPWPRCNKGTLMPFSAFDYMHWPV